jgi:hypothetical protein
MVSSRSSGVVTAGRWCGTTSSRRPTSVAPSCGAWRDPSVPVCIFRPRCRHRRGSSSTREGSRSGGSSRCSSGNARLLKRRLRRCCAGSSGAVSPTHDVPSRNAVLAIHPCGASTDAARRTAGGGQRAACRIFRNRPGKPRTNSRICPSVNRCPTDSEIDQLQAAPCSGWPSGPTGGGHGMGRAAPPPTIRPFTMKAGSRVS